MTRHRPTAVRAAAAATAVATALILGAGGAQAAPAPPAPPGATCASANGPGGPKPHDARRDPRDGPDDAAAEVIVKIDVADGYSIGDLSAACPIVVDSAILASRGIYLVHSTEAGAHGPRADDLTRSLAAQPSVVYAEPNSVLRLDDTRWHAWSDGPIADAGYDPAAYTGQPAATSLNLGMAWAFSRGAGVTMAVLDTGVDPDHPALQGRLVPGWDYVDDDADTDEQHGTVDESGNGDADDAYGHGTFVAGIAALVAPDAKILPERVLDADGYGNVFVISQAILDAVADGAKVINLSFGTAGASPSHLLDDAIGFAQARGVVVIAAAGNDHSSAPHFPAASHGVLSVSALAENGSDLASYSDYGPWVDVAAPGTPVVGPVPGGGYAYWAGTSMAAPFATGQAALLRALRPTATSDQLVTAINRTAVRIDRAQLAFGQINILLSLLVPLGRP